MKTIQKEINSCRECKSIIGHKKFPNNTHGNIKSRVILVSEAPGKKSLTENKYWVSAGGKILRDCLPNEIELENLFYLTDIVKCWPNENKENRKPNENEIRNCSPFLTKEIRRLQPIIILSFGGISSSFLLNRPVKITKEHGKISTYNESTKIITLLQPSGIDRFMDRRIYKEQLTSLFEKIKENDLDNINEIFKSNKWNPETKN